MIGESSSPKLEMEDGNHEENANEYKGESAPKIKAGWLARAPEIFPHRRLPYQNYSARKACTGSTFEARAAGSHTASRAMAVTRHIAVRVTVGVKPDFHHSAR